MGGPAGSGQGEAAPLRVLGIDPGIATCGYGLIEAPDGGRARPAVVEFGAVRPRGPGDPARLADLYAAVCRLLDTYRPDTAAVERLYHNRNVSTAAAVGQARGVILLALARAGLPIGEYTPTEVKLAVAGYGGADKRQMQAMVAVQLGLAEPPRPDDAADALGLCLCHLLGQGLQARLASAGYRQDAPGGRRSRALLEAVSRTEHERRAGLRAGRRLPEAAVPRPARTPDGAEGGSTSEPHG